ncbi:MAG: peptide chain release factor N(5)-glutamine methyltransferase [Candidatus Omnitrophica bacterium]|nr:peptide chain release factor N(5)-glutamine methyltransferase [Candidatus Omnitrophota bacterium]
MSSSLKTQKNIYSLINRYLGRVSQVEAEALLSYIFKCSRSELYVNELIIDEQIERLYDLLIARRTSGEPLQHITGIAEFMEMDFNVDKDVFIPRPETEILVNEVSGDIRNRERASKVLDLCTGSGNIAIGLARSVPVAEIIATDISESALDRARMNSVSHGTEKRVLFYKGDLFDALPLDKKYKFDIIVCNPPYVKRGDIGLLQEEVQAEPRIALDGGLDGLDFYRQIAGKALAYLSPGGSLFLEIGAGQAEDTSVIFESKGKFRVRKIIKDFAGIDRVLWIDLL